MFTTLARSSGAAGAQYGWDVVTPLQVARLSWGLIGGVVCLGFAALAVSLLLERKFSVVLLLALLAMAGTLVTIENMRLHSSTSVAKHDDFGVWFTCIAAGYALARAAELARRWRIKIPILITAVALTAWVGVRYTEYGPVNTAAQQAAELRLYGSLRPYLQAESRGQYLMDLQILYVDHVNVPWYQYIDDGYIKYPVAGRGGNIHGAPGLACGAPGEPPPGPNCVYLEGNIGYRAAIHAHWINMVSMIGHDHPLEDAVILTAVRGTPGYKLISTAGGGPTYIYAPDYPQRLGGTRR